MQLQSAVSLLSVLSVPAPPSGVGEAYSRAYDSYLKAFEGCRGERSRCLAIVEQAASESSGVVAAALGVGVGVVSGTAETVTTWAAEVIDKSGAAGACVSAPSECVNRGVHYVRNRQRKEREKERKRKEKKEKDVADLQFEVETAQFSNAKMAAEKSLALRRVAENRVAEALAKHKLASLRDKDKTEAVRRLDAARMEEKINGARAKSQASYKQCDNSLKSLGSTGSAGEFALKREAKRAKDLELKNEYLQKQLDLVFPDATEETRGKVAALVPPVFESSQDLFGECPSDYDEDQAEAYYIRLARDDEENDLF